ncbi:lyase family protein [Actinoplanes sp. N902-109]|uniref:lyase family protein n=1 Tax=Actinoplanes sp. (strain N902-109) TaxID=649831 RepID=UPI000685A900|nr:lyase family protein [Actinoplanes sp. N902-109]
MELSAEWSEPPPPGLFDGVLAAGRVRTEVADTAWVRALLDAEAALARATATAGLADAADAEAVARACATLDVDIAAVGAEAAATGTPVVPLVQRLRAALSGSAADLVHRGATSQDIVDTAAMLVARRALGPLLDDLGAAADRAAALAGEHRATPVAGRTLLQQALPTTFGLIAAGWAGGLDAARRQLTQVRDHRLAAQLGGAVGTLAGFNPTDREAAPANRETAPAGRETAPAAGKTAPTGHETAPTGHEATPAAAETAPTGHDTAHTGDEAPPAGSAGRARATGALTLVAAYSAELGLAEPALPWHTERTRIAELAGALGTAAGAIGKVARDVTLHAQTEVGELSEGGGGGGSSTLPHKHNPIHAISAAAAATTTPGLVASVLAAMPQDYQRAAGAWHAEWQPLRALLVAAGSAAYRIRVCLEVLEVHADRMRANLDVTHGALLAERVAGALRPVLGAGAHDVVRAAVLRGDLTTDPAITAHLGPDELARLLDPAGYLGSARALVDRALDR